MTGATPTDWKMDFGLTGRKPPHFFSSVDQLDDTTGKVPQPHAPTLSWSENNGSWHAWIETHCH